MRHASALSARIGFRQPRKPHRVPRYVALIVAAFAASSAAFVGATFFADQRLALVAARAGDVANDAMPSIEALSAMRRQLAYVQFGHMDLFDGHLQAYHDALQRYESLRQFPEERPAWETTRNHLNDTERMVERIRGLIGAGRLEEADALVEHVLQPSVAEDDQALAGLVRENRRLGDLAATTGAQALASTRRIALLLDAIAAAFAAALAVAAAQGVMRVMTMEHQRADELEAFSSRVAHDLRGPLNTAGLYVASAGRGLEANDPRAVALQKCARSLRHVEDLVRDLLAFARAGATPEPNARTPLRSTVADVMTDVADLASKNRVQLEIEDMPDCQIACAPGILQSMIGNLVTNAIKYMPADASERVVSIRAAENRGLVRVEVADTGAGVPEEARDRIFQPYVRAQTGQPGLGLGLATVRRLAEAHGGRVGVRCVERRGSVFWFEAPIFREPQLTRQG